jgi:phage tail sheath protein FI
LLEPLDVPGQGRIQLKGGADGLALLGVYDLIGEAVSPLDSDVVRARKVRGLRALEEISEVAILAVPDIHIQPVDLPPRAPVSPCVPDPCLPLPVALPAAPRAPSVGDLPARFSEAAIYQVQAAMVQQCEQRRDRIAILDVPFTAARPDALGLSAAQAWRSRFDSKYAAFYYPWLRVVDPLRTPTTLTRDIPPSGHAAGQYARTDLEVGVHKAPANAPLGWVQDVTVAVDDAAHGLLNSGGINVVRALPGRGIRLLGARTASSDPTWRYVNVRRLLMMVEKAIDLATQWVVFEPNDIFTRPKLRLSLMSFLIALWQRGALMGNTIQEAFFVKCDEDNNPDSERANGRLLAEVGVAPSIPFEFIVLRVERTANELEIVEAFGRYGGG